MDYSDPKVLEETADPYSAQQSAHTYAEQKINGNTGSSEGTAGNAASSPESSINHDSVHELAEDTPFIPEGKKKNRTAAALIVGAGTAIVIAVVNLILVFVMPTDEERWQQQYDLGQQYLLEMDYEQAIVAFTAAIEINEKDPSAWTGRAESYYALGIQTMEEAEASEAEDSLMQTAAEYLDASLSDYKTAISLGDTQPAVYIAAADVYVALGDYDGALEMLEEGLQSSPEDADLLNRQSEINALLQRKSIEEIYWDDLMALVAVLEENPEDVGTTYWLDEDFRSFSWALAETQFWELDNNLWLGVYPGGYVYYGEMSNGERSGHGVYYFCNPLSEEVIYGLDNLTYSIVNYLYIGEWSDDYPNGWGIYCEYLLGMEDGSVAAIIHEFEISFENGCACGSGTFRTTESRGSGECAIEAIEGGCLLELYESGSGSYEAYIEELHSSYTFSYIRVMDAYLWNEEEAAESSEENNTGTESEDSEGTEKEEAALYAEENALALYADVLDTFYYGISSEWSDYGDGEYLGDLDQTDDLSYLWWMYPSDKTLTNTGYALLDLDGNGIPELLVSLAGETGNNWSAGTGMIYDMYTWEDGTIVHILESGERYRYYLCSDSTVYLESSGGASLTGYDYYQISGSALVLLESLEYDSTENPDEPYYYRTETDDEWASISEDTAMSIMNSYTKQEYSLTLFSEYTPSI